MQLLVASYNIYHGQGMDGIFDLAGIADVIRSSGADIVGLQEVDKGTTRCGGVDQAAEIAGHLGFQCSFAPHFPYKGGDYGVAILTRFPIENEKYFALPTAPGCEPRTLMQVTVNVNSALVDIFNTHLEVRNQDIRELQCDMVSDILSQHKGPAILMGDMNAQPGDWDLKNQLTQFMWDADTDGNNNTFPSGNPRKRIDYILCSSHWSAQEKRVTVVDSIRSDHVMIVAPLQLTN